MTNADSAGTTSTGGAAVSVAAIVGAPDFIVPWLDRFYDEEDARLVLAAAAVPPAAEERGGSRSGLDAVPSAALERAVRRAVLDGAEPGAYAPASFHARLEIWAMFEGWKDVPLAVHRRLAEWDLEHYAESIRQSVEAIRDGRPEDSDHAAYSYILLHEAEDIVAGAEHVYLWPCDCRSIVSSCRKPVDVCLRFSNDRGLGWEISRERAVDLLRSADKAGLMHTDQLGAGADGPQGICNCCTDCCYPHLATERLGTGGVWPVRRHVALIDTGLCKTCGRCALRCPFGAITPDDDGTPAMDASLCRGCGLCATGCTAAAIEMRPLA